MRMWIYRLKRFFKETVPLNVAYFLPARVKLWAWILVESLDGNAPGPDYKQKYDYAVKRFGIE